MHRINLQDLADQLGVARSTVSRALRDDPLIATETRRRVKEAAEKLGYRSNPYVSVLMSRLRAGAPPSNSPVIAFLNPQATRDGWRDNKPMVAAVRAAATRAQELGFELQEFWLGEPGMTPERLREILHARGIRALILGTPGHLNRLVPFPTDGFAAVAIDLEPARENLHRATSDYLGNTLRCLKAMRELGYRRVGLALDRNIFAHMHQQPRMAFLDFEESLPRADRTGYWIGEWADVAGFARWLLDARPDGIVTINVFPQVWLQPLGLRIPQDIGVAQLDPEFFPFPLSGIDGRFDRVGRNAMDLLMTQIHRNEFTPPTEPMHVVNPGVWRPGVSTMDRTTVPIGNPYDELRVAICQAAARNDIGALLPLRQRFAERFYSDPFALARDTSAEAWRCLPLSSLANMPFHSPLRHPSFTQKNPIGFAAGVQKLRGVPFDLPASTTTGPNTVLALNHEDERGKRRNAVTNRRLPVQSRIRAVYFLHCAFYQWAPVSPGQYRLVLEDGRTHSVDLVPYWPPANGAKSAAFQDVWYAMPQFESDMAKAVFCPAVTKPFEFDCYFYVYELRNPHPDVVVQAVEFVANPESPITLVIAGLTALLAES